MTYEDYTQEVISFIRKKRKERGFTQTQMAKMLGCTIVTYHSFEKGKGTNSARFMWDVLDCLGLELSFHVKEKKLPSLNG